MVFVKGSLHAQGHYYLVKTGKSKKNYLQNWKEGRKRDETYFFSALFCCSLSLSVGLSLTKKEKLWFFDYSKGRELFKLSKF